jgi:hypothetical protein
LTVLATPVDLTRPARYIHWGWIQISLANLVVIALMIVVLIVAIALPFPRRAP